MCALYSIAYILPTLEVNQIMFIIIVTVTIGLNEHVQRSAIHIMLGRDYELYDKALAFLGREALEIRRVHLCQKFATRTIKKPKICKLVLLNGQSAIITD